jgi:hypothetical protein
MSNAGFNAATDIFGLGASFRVKGANLNKSCSTAECKNYLGDVTHRDQHGERIAPTADYELAAEWLDYSDKENKLTNSDNLRKRINERRAY